MIFTITMNPCLDRFLYVDDLIEDDTVRVKEVREYPAGKGIDAARVIKELGGTSVAIALLGGCIGRKIEEMLDKEGVIYTAVRVDVETRTNVIIQKGIHQYRLSLPGQPVAREKLEVVREILQALVREGDYVIISGSLPSGVGPEYYAGLVFMLKNWGAVVYLDTDGENLKNGILGEPYAIKPNLHELKRLLGKDVKIGTGLVEDAMEIIERYNVEEILLTLGKEGSYLITKDEKYMAKVPDVPVISAVGAGDSFLAAYVLKRSEGLDRKEAFRWGNAAGTASVMTPGTELCKKEDVVKLLDKIEVITL